MGALLFDADGDGDNDLVVVSGGSFMTSNSTTFQARLYVNDGHGRFALAPDALSGIATSGSAVVAADYDGDGKLDLFIGGRVIPGKYPLPPRSYLLHNDGARFTELTGGAAPALGPVGLESSAPWTDSDQAGTTVACRGPITEPRRGMMQRCTRSTDYPEATLQPTLAPAEREASYTGTALTFRSAQLQDVGTGKLALRSLPLRAQIGPLMRM